MNCYTLYEVLQCSKDSSYEDLKRNYRRLVLRHHPDKADTVNGDNNEKFREIERAWAILRDPQLKRRYDAECKQAQLESQSGPICATLRMNEMEVSPDGETLSYPCRCGSDYLIERLKVSEENCTFHIPCQDCTFVVAIET